MSATTTAPPPPAHVGFAAPLGFAPDEAPDARAQRVALVHAWQRHYGMAPRADSQLTQLFADGALGAMPADEVARELLATDYLHKRTLYDVLKEDVLRGIAARLRKEHRGLSWTATWTIVRFYGPIALKLMCLSAASERIPDRMPAEGAMDVD